MKQNTQQCAWTYTLCILASLLVLNGAFPNYILDAHQFKNLFQTPNLDREQLLV